MIWLLGSANILAYGLTVAGSLYPLGAGVLLPAPELAVQGAVWGEVEEYGDVWLDRCRAFMPVPGQFRRFSVLNSGVRFWPYRPSGRSIWASTT